jgi:hypothetical protein
MAMIGHKMKKDIAAATSDPPDFSMQYNTDLTPDQWMKFLEWKRTLPGDLQNTQDYDLQGAYLDSVVPSGNLHLTDKFKKPNHPTFSDGSIYSNPQAPGGQWVEGKNGAWEFVATHQNLKYRTPDALMDYFRNYEPGNRIIFPK